MDQTEKKRFAAVMKGLAVNAGAEITEDMMRLYSKALIQFSIDDIEHAGIDILKTWEYNRMPPLAIIIKNLEGKAIPIEDRALVLANDILSHLQTYGSGKFPDLKGDKIAVHLMTRRWPYRRWGSEILESEFKWWTKEFCDAYRSYSETDAPLRISAPKAVKELAADIGNTDLKEIVIADRKAFLQEQKKQIGVE